MFMGEEKDTGTADSKIKNLVGPAKGILGGIGAGGLALLLTIFLTKENAEALYIKRVELDATRNQIEGKLHVLDKEHQALINDIDSRNVTRFNQLNKKIDDLIVILINRREK